MVGLLSLSLSSRLDEKESRKEGSWSEPINLELEENVGDERANSWVALYREEEYKSRAERGSNFEENIKHVELVDGSKIYHVGGSRAINLAEDNGPD